MARNKCVTSPEEKLLAGAPHRHEGTCWLWERSRDPHGYGKFGVGCEKVYAHRMAYALTHGPIPPGAVVRHTCDTPACVNPAHLLVGTQADNVRDTKDRGRVPRGQDHATSKLTEAAVRSIREASHAGVLQRIIAEAHGVCQKTVSKIVSRRCWTHI